MSRTQEKRTERQDGRARSAWKDPAYQGFWILRLGFTVAPIVAGADKFTHFLVNWDRYLAPQIDDMLPWTASQIMQAVGVVEVFAGVIVFLWPRFGGYLVAAWLAGIITNLLMAGEHYDIALRDFGLMLGALALARLATVYSGMFSPGMAASRR